MRALICGGRDFFDYYYLCQTMEIICKWQKIEVIIHGAAKGADSLAERWAKEFHHEIRIERYPAEWDRFGKAAGFIRNQRMLIEGVPDLVIAFPGGDGTEMMCTLAKKAKVQVIRV